MPPATVGLPTRFAHRHITFFRYAWLRSIPMIQHEGVIGSCLCARRASHRLQGCLFPIGNPTSPPSPFVPRRKSELQSTLCPSPQLNHFSPNCDLIPLIIPIVKLFTLHNFPDLQQHRFERNGISSSAVSNSFCLDVILSIRSDQRIFLLLRCR